ncbi:MAG TPA: cupin-like domain-containing protein [Asticcacaulis sp.]|nr:cupin-like domain-containing protein [Asticcacaulis sp.]
MSDDVFSQLNGIEVVEAITPETFKDRILPREQPVVLKGVVADWPIVRLAQQSDEAAADYIASCDIGRPAQTLLGDPSIKGEFFYGDDLNRFNFQKGTVPIPVALRRMLDQRSEARPYAVYIQSTPIEEYLPRFLEDHRLPILPPDVLPRIWIGNQLRVQTHYDLFSNVACVAAGKRRFTLFPPDQLANLYPGPLDKTIAGPPVSMASIENPDFERYPRFAEALKHAQTAELEPGDGIYIPYFWWHQVRSLEPFNVLVNYWWDDNPPGLGLPFDALLHGLLALRDLPPARRRAWKAMFDYFVFGEQGEPMAHLKPEDRGPLGSLNEDQRRGFYVQLVRNLEAQWSDKA